MSKPRHLQRYVESKIAAVDLFDPGSFEIQVRPRDREGRLGLTVILGPGIKPLALRLDEEDARYLLEELEDALGEDGEQR